MAKIVELPKLSPTMEEGTLVRWAKSEGESVQVDDLLAEVETDKATMEFRAFDRGTLLKQLVAEGSVAKLGQPVAIFGEPGEDISALVASAGPSAPKGAPSLAVAPADAAERPDVAHAEVRSDQPGDRDEGKARAVVVEPSPSSGSAEPSPQPRRRRDEPAANLVASTKGLAGVVLLPAHRREGASPPADGSGGAASPRVRRLARERGVDLSRVHGTGSHGRITTRDLEQVVASAPAAASVRVSGRVGDASRPEPLVRPASSMRKTIARRLTEAKREVPHFYLEADLDFDALTSLREQLNDGVEKGERVSVTDLLLRACALALRAVPASNASWVDGTIVEHRRCDISVAVAIEDGLVTPVVRDCDKKSVRAIGAELRSLAERARAKKLKPEEMTDGVFSLSNLGMYGVDRFAAVINPPEGMILAVGATREVPVVRQGALAIGRRCAVTLSCDHRVVDGALGARFLQALRALVEKPVQILA